MKKLSMSLLMLLTIVGAANAKIFRVGFTATNPVAGIDYQKLQDAHDAANIGDTIQIYPTNPTTTYTCNMTKRLNLIGTGYLTDGNFNSNSGLQNITGDCNVNLTLDAGSSGSIFQGLGTTKMTNTGTYIMEGLVIGIVQFAAVNNIIVKRCNVMGVQLANYAPNDLWTFSDCYFGFNNNGGYYSGPITAYLLNPNIPSSGGNAITNLRIENCIFATYSLFPLLDLSNASSTGNSGQIVNCVSNATLINFNNGAFLVQNNVFPNGNSFTNASNCIFQNNVTTTAQGGNSMNTGNNTGNKFGVSFTITGGSTTNFNSVFVGWPYNLDNSNKTVYSEDAKWQLKANSVASGASTTGGDCGAFGGVSPYKIAGIPPTPAFYKLAATSNTANTSPYTITFSVRSNN